MAFGEKGWVNEIQSSHLCILIPLPCCIPIKNSRINWHELNTFRILSSFVKNQDEQSEIREMSKRTREAGKKSPRSTQSPWSQLSENPAHTPSGCSGEVMNAQNTETAQRVLENKRHTQTLPENTSRPQTTHVHSAAAQLFCWPHHECFHYFSTQYLQWVFTQ